ncbi:unnamed protein product [Blepharisma stoltei]|uniref:PKD/REJ-like domain-containing protein n=1 Tax=Blepharisma stoltei TaxID=1481888 RepID=A0AAU9IH96_9CILI|nr:unnamed protein product [Blepharisma stoltei]
MIKFLALTLLLQYVAQGKTYLGGLIATSSPISFSPTQIRSAASYNLKFSLFSFTPIDAIITVIFPDNSVLFSSSSNYLCSLSRSDNSIPPNAYCISDFSTRSISIYNFFLSGVVIAGSNAVFSIDFLQINNPKTTEITSAVIIKTLTSSSSLIDQSDSQDFNLTIQATTASMTSASIIAESNIIGDITTWTFSYQPLYESIALSTIYIEFPSWNGYIGASGSDIQEIITTTNPSCIGVTNIDSAITCSWNSQNRTLIVTNGFPSFSIQGIVIFNVTSCNNPPRSAALTGFRFYLKSSNSWIYESSTKSVSVSVSKPNIIKIDNSAVSLSNSQTQVRTYLSIKFSPNVPFLKDDIIEYSVPSETSFYYSAYINNYNGFSARPDLIRVSSNVVRAIKGFPYYSSPSLVNIEIIYMLTPNSTKPTGTFTIRHLSSNLDVIAEGSGGAIKVNPSSLSMKNFNPYLISTNYTIKATATYYFQFLINKVPAGCSIVVYFPLQIKAASRASAVCQYILFGLDGNAKCLVQNNILYIFDGFQREYNGEIWFGIDQITNPDTNAATKSFNITTYTDNTLTYMIDSTASNIVFTATYNSNFLQVVPWSFTTGDNTTYLFIVSTSYTIPAGSQISISFPANITVSSSINTCYEIIGVNTNSYTCNYVNNQLLITNWFNSIKDPGTLSFYINGVINPFSTKTSDPFKATIYDSYGNIVDFISTGLNTVRMSSIHWLSPFLISMSDNTNGATSNYTVSITTFNPIPAVLRIELWSLLGLWSSMLSQPICEAKSSSIISISCARSSSTLIASLVLSNDLPSKTVLSYSIWNVKNPITTKSSYIAATTIDSGGYAMEYSSTYLVTIPANITDINITAANNEIGMKTNYTISYFPVNLHPSGSSLTINIPPEFSLGNVGCIPITLGYKFNCSISLFSITTINGFDSSYNSSAKISFAITNIVNPPRKIVTSPWILKSWAGTYQIDQSTAIISSFNCSSSCSECKYASTNCTSCYEDYYLLNSSCVASCPPNHISNSTARVCMLCPSLYPIAYNNTCSQKCLDHQWKDNGICYDCISPCLTCKSSSFCTSCAQAAAHPNLVAQVYLYPDDGTCLIECPLGTLPNSTTFTCDPCFNCIPCPDGFYSTLGTNDCANLCDESCKTCTSKFRCLECLDYKKYFDGDTCKYCDRNFYSNLDGKTCSHCLVNQYSDPGENICRSTCSGPSCEFCIKCDKECRKCWNYDDFIPMSQAYIIICLELEIPDEEFIVGQISDEFIVNMNHSCPNLLLKSMNDEIRFITTEYSNFKIIINPEYDIINNPPYFSIEIGKIPLNVSINPKYDDFSLFIMNNENFIQQSYEQFGRVFIKLQGGIIFNANLYYNNTYSCYSMLSDTTISEMGGKSIQCYIQNESNLIIIMDQWTAATNFLVFKNNVFSKKNQPNITNLKFINLEIKNFNPSHPVPIINSVSRICCGCNFTLDASLSSGLGVLNYKWYINNVFFSKEPVTYTLARDCGVKSDIEVKLEINDLWHTEIVQKNIKLEQVPSILVINRDDAITTHKYATFSADVYWNSTTQSSSIFDIEWSYWPGNSKTQAITIKGQKEFSTVFYDEVNYTISATAIPRNADFASDNETIYIVPAPDIPMLLIIGVNSSIYWAAQISFYVDLVYSDGYKDRKYPIVLSEINCPYGNLTGSRNGDFSFLGRENENYWCGFTVNVTFSSKIFKSIPCYFNVSRSKVPEVYVPYYWDYFDYSAPTRFMANIPDQTDLIIKWVKTDSNPEIDISTPKNQSSYTIDAFTLIPGLTYEFKIIARNNITNATTEVVTRRPVNSPPQGGSFSITPTSGYSLDTKFLAIFSGWADPEQNKPLSYQVFQQNDKEAIAITPKTSSSVFTLSIGSVGNISLIGRIYDGLGTFTNKTFLIEVKPVNKDSKSEADQLKTAGLNMDQTMYISKIVAISKHTFENYMDGNYTQSVINILVDALNLWTFSKSISLSDVSASVDIVSVFLNQSKIYDKNLISNISWTLENVLNQTPKLDFGTYSVFLKEIDLLSSRIYELNSLQNNSTNQLSFFENFDKSFQEASTKYQITTNPNENSIKYNGEFYNSTIVSKDKNTLNTPISLDKVGLIANFYVDTSQDNDNTIYHQSLISFNSIGNITSSLILNSSAYSATIGSCSFHKDNWQLESSDFKINQEFKYPSSISSPFIKPNITKTTSDLYSRNYEQVNASNVVLAISPSLLSSEGDYSCQILDQSSNIFSASQCKTKLNSDHSYTCECEFLNLISLIPSPDVYPVIKNILGKIELEVYEGFSWITFAIFSLLTIIYLVLLRDLIRIDKFTHKLLKRKVKSIIAKIKDSIKDQLNLLQSRENIDNCFENAKLLIYKDVINHLSDPKEKMFLPNLLTKKRIMKQANDSFIERDLAKLISRINEMDLDEDFQRIKNRLITKKGYMRKIYYYIMKIFKIKDQDKIFFSEIIENEARKLGIEIDFTEELIEKLLEYLKKPNIIMYQPEELEKKEDKKNIAGLIYLEFKGLQNVLENRREDKTLYNESRIENLIPYDIELNSQYKSNWYFIFVSYLQRNIHSNFEPEHSFTYYFLKDNLVLGLIGFTNLNFSRKGRLTLLMVSLFINTWLTILLFGSGYHFDNQELYYGISKLHVILYALSFAIGLIVTIIAIFLPSNYLKEEFLAKKVFKSVTSRIFYGVSWIVMIMLFITGCMGASKLDLYDQVTLTKEIFMNLFFAILSEAFVKPLCWWCYKWFKYNELSPIVGVLIKRLNCCKKPSKGIHEKKILPEAGKI